MNDYSPEEEKTLEELRGILEPPPGVAKKVAFTALDGSVSRPRHRMLAAALALGAGVAMFVLAIRKSDRRTATAWIENTGSVVLAADASGEKWLFSHSRSTERREKGMIFMTRGEGR